MNTSSKMLKLIDHHQKHQTSHKEQTNDANGLTEDLTMDSYNNMFFENIIDLDDESTMMRDSTAAAQSQATSRAMLRRQLHHYSSNDNYNGGADNGGDIMDQHHDINNHHVDSSSNSTSHKSKLHVPSFPLLIATIVIFFIFLFSSRYQRNQIRQLQIEAEEIAIRNAAIEAAAEEEEEDEDDETNHDNNDNDAANRRTTTPKLTKEERIERRKLKILNGIRQNKVTAVSFSMKYGLFDQWDQSQSVKVTVFF